MLSLLLHVSSDPLVNGRMLQATFLLLSFFVTANSTFSCPSGWTEYRSSCYNVVQVTTGVNWATASASCSNSSMLGALATIKDARENWFVFSLLPRGYRGLAWIGLEDQIENNFTWVDNSSVQYTNWEIGEPNNLTNEDCVVMKGDNGRWSDTQCANAYTVYICKKNKSIKPKAGSDEEQGCTTGSIGYGAQCYTFVQTGKNYNDAQRDCKTRYQYLGNLATVDSGHLHTFLAAELVTLQGTAYWIGLQQNNDVYKWQSNWPVSFTYWGKNHTGSERGTCVAMQTSGLWANYPCNQGNIFYICESPRTGFTTPASKAAVTIQMPCPNGWTGYGSLCYNVFSKNVSDMLTWGDARVFCAKQAVGGSLVTINNRATQAWLMAAVIKTSRASGNYWIGLNDRDSESGYVWEDDTPFVFTNWRYGEPNDQQNTENCVEWILPQNYWNDAYCYVSKNWICQVPRGSQITTPKPVPTGVYSSSCPNASWIEYNNYCYFVSALNSDSSTATWHDARTTCINLGGDLASIGGDDENGFITSLISKKRTPLVYAFWIGLNSLDSDNFGWTDLSPVSYVNWAPKEPNNNFGGERCAEMWAEGFWNDIQCQAKFGYVCKKPAGDAIVTPYIPVPPQGGCPVGFVSLPTLSFCYAVGGTTNTTRKSFLSALDQCGIMARRSTLASIHSRLEEKFILLLIADLRTPAWIGLNDRRRRNQFEWVDNLAVSYTNWGPGQPDEDPNNTRPSAILPQSFIRPDMRYNNEQKDCVDIQVGEKFSFWNDQSCNIPMAYVCESRKGAHLPTAAPHTTGCNTGYQRFRNSCYKFYEDLDTWAVAESTCQSDGGNLVTIRNGIEQAFVEILTGHVNDSLQFWLGLKYDQVSTAFSWQDGWPGSFTNWGQSEPNTKGGQSCVTHTVDGQWHMVNCSVRHPFACAVIIDSPTPTRKYNIEKCPRNWFAYAGNCYHIEASSPKSWGMANAACTYVGGNLTSIHTDVEARTLANYVRQLGQDVWIGLFKRQGGGFTWYDGTEMKYQNWGAGQPNYPGSALQKGCVTIQNKDGTWANADCSDQNAYLCKIGQVYPLVTDQSGHVVTGGDNGMSDGSVAGIVLGALILVVLLACFGLFAFRHFRDRSMFHIREHQLISSESGFENASYSSSGGVVSVNSSDA